MTSLLSSSALYLRYNRYFSSSLNSLGSIKSTAFHSYSGLLTSDLFFFYETDTATYLIGRLSLFFDIGFF